MDNRMGDTYSIEFSATQSSAIDTWHKPSIIFNVISMYTGAQIYKYFNGQKNILQKTPIYYSQYIFIEQNKAVLLKNKKYMYI
jgi:hypothetical protein